MTDGLNQLITKAIADTLNASGDYAPLTDVQRACLSGNLYSAVRSAVFDRLKVLYAQGATLEDALQEMMGGTQRMREPQLVDTWQHGNGPAPKGYGIRCTGCSRCKLDGHLPMDTP